MYESIYMTFLQSYNYKEKNRSMVAGDREWLQRLKSWGIVGSERPVLYCDYGCAHKTKCLPELSDLFEKGVFTACKC